MIFSSKVEDLISPIEIVTQMFIIQIFQLLLHRNVSFSTKNSTSTRQMTSLLSLCHIFQVLELLFFLWFYCIIHIVYCWKSSYCSDFFILLRHSFEIFYKTHFAIFEISNIISEKLWRTTKPLFKVAVKVFIRNRLNRTTCHICLESILNLDLIEMIIVFLLLVPLAEAAMKPCISGCEGLKSDLLGEHVYFERFFFDALNKHTI